MFAKAEYERLLNALHKIGQHAPHFLNEFNLRIFSILPKLLGEFRVTALQLIEWSADSIQDLFQKLQPELHKLLLRR
jgi:hypothetical protein